MAKLESLINLLTEKELIAYREAVGKRAAKEFKKLLIENIKTNKFGFTLADSTIAKKLGLNRSTTPLIDTGDYLKSIVTKATKVGVADGVHKPSGLSYKEIRWILEHGRLDKSIPARPVWRLTLKEFKPTYRKICKEEFVKYFMLNLNRK